MGELFADGLAVTGDYNTAVGPDLDDGISIVFFAGAFNHRLQRVVMNPLYLAVAP
jgi:hypothetical protein